MLILNPDVYTSGFYFLITFTKPVNTMPKKTKPIKRDKKKTTAAKKKVTPTQKLSKVNINNYSKFVQRAIREHYDELKADGVIHGSFQTYLNKSGDAFFQKFFVDKQKSAGKFRIETILSKAHEGYKRFFIKYK